VTQANFAVPPQQILPLLMQILQVGISESRMSIDVEQHSISMKNTMKEVFLYEC
jgi:hypothetical protein